MRTVFFFVALVLLASCQSDGARARARAAEAAAKGERAAPSPQVDGAQPRLLADPPLGRWRLADPGVMDRTVFWLSHILIRHAEAARPDEVPFNYGQWRMGVPPATRSRQAALKRAEELAAQANQAPERFGELARRFSEDPSTKDVGGSLGGMSAVMFLISPPFLDLFQQTPIGGVSKVIESAHGFHVFLRRSPPAELQVSGEHIVIAHDDAPAISMFARGAVPHRSRAEALALAERIYAEAKQAPDHFRQLVERSSDYEDAPFGGDLGSWSTREVTPIPREVETLATLAVGEVAPPLDTVYGFQILKRTPNRPRANWAMGRVELYFDPVITIGDESQASVLALARKKLAAIAGDPGRFTEAEQQHCCTNVLRVTEGRFSARIEAELARLEPGQIAAEPMLYGGSVYLLVERLPDSMLPPAPITRFELESPARPDLPYFMGTRSGPFIEKGLQALAEKARVALGLDIAHADALTRLHASARFSDLAEAERWARFTQLQTSVHELLGAADAKRYDELLQQHFETLMYQSGAFSNTGEY